jgi:integrase/recombinase XerD
MPGSKPTIKQKLAAIRMLYDFLVIRQLVPVNPTASVRGPKYVVKRGKTPFWSREDAKKLLESIPRDDLAGLRDRALISTVLFSFARVSAVLSLKRQDFYYQGPRRWLRFHEKGGKEHEMPAHHQIEELSMSTSLKLISRTASPCSRASIRQVPRYPAGR